MRKPAAFLALGILLFAAVSAAEDTRPVDELVTPSETFRDDFSKRPTPVSQRPSIRVVEEAPVPEPAADGPSFFVREIRLEGNVRYSRKDLSRHLARAEGRKVTFGELQSVASAITAHYRERGFATSRAFVPPQTVENETVTIRVVEAKVGTVKVEGNKFYADRVYTEAIHAEPNEPLNLQNLESDLFFLNQKPGRRAEAFLEPGTEPGTSDILLKAHESNPVRAYYGFNNRGTKLTHRGRHSAHVDHYNLTGHSDELRTALTGAEDGALGAGAISYRFPIERTGTTLSLDTSYSKTRLVKHLKPANIEGESLGISPGLTQTLYRTPTLDVSLYAGLDVVDSKALIDEQKTSFDRMRVIRTGPRVTHRDKTGRTLLSADVHWGLDDFLGSSSKNETVSRPNSGGEFLFFTADWARIQQLPFYRSFLIARAGGQWTDDNLTSVEQFRAGGIYSVRGYPEADALGDVGYHFSLEWSVPASFFPDDWRLPYYKTKWKDSIRLAAFLDGAKTFSHNRALSTDTKDEFLLGAGVGVRVNVDERFALQLDYAQPIGDDSSDKDRRQFHLAMTSGF